MKIFTLAILLLTTTAAAWASASPIGHLQGKLGSITHDSNGEYLRGGSCSVGFNPEKDEVYIDQPSIAAMGRGVTSYFLMQKAQTHDSAGWNAQLADGAFALCGVFRARYINKSLVVRPSFVEIRIRYNCGAAGTGETLTVATRCEF